MALGQEKGRLDEEYGAEDGLATVIAIYNDISEKKAREWLSKVPLTGTPEEIEELNKGLDQLRAKIPFQKYLPSETRRQIFEKVGRMMVKQRNEKLRMGEATDTSGSLMLKIAACFFSKKKIERVFQPLVADYRQEHAAALREGKFKAMLVKLEYWWAFGKTIGFDKVLDAVAKIWTFGGP